MKEVLKRGMLKFENSFFSHVVRCALGMIIPLVLTGGIACAVRDFPVAPYQMFLTQGGGRWFYDFLTMVYEGTYGIFSVALVITIVMQWRKMNRWKMSLCMWLWHLPHSAHS